MTQARAAAAETAPLIDQPVTERDWQARAWERLSSVRARHAGMTLDQALAHAALGGVVRGFAKQLEREDAARRERAAKEARWGRKVVSNGFGVRPVQRRQR